LGPTSKGGGEGKGEERGGERGEGTGEEAFLVMWPRRLSALNPPLALAPPTLGSSGVTAEPDT